MKIIQALKIVFRKDRGVNLIYISLFLFFVIAFILFFIELQVLLTPEPDDLFLYLKIWQIKDWLIVGLLSILVSLNFVFFVYLITHTNLSRIVSNLSRILLYEFISNFHECFTNLFIYEFFTNGNEFVSNSLLFNL
jgi:hypothetical protein